MSVSEAFFMQGLGKKQVQQGGPGATWALPIPIGTFAITAKVEVENRNTGITAVSVTLSPEGSKTINGKTTTDFGNVRLSGVAEASVMVLQAVVGTDAAATVFLRCNATAGRAEVSGGTMIAQRLNDPNFLHIEKAQVE